MHAQAVPQWQRTSRAPRRDDRQYLFRPGISTPTLSGADISIYSATKYLGGFSDIIGGVALGKDPVLMGKIRSKRSLFGNILQPDECWILDTRLPTVYLRMNRQSKNAQRMAEALAGTQKFARSTIRPCSTIPNR